MGYLQNIGNALKAGNDLIRKNWIVLEFQKFLKMDNEWRKKDILTNCVTVCLVKSTAFLLRFGKHTLRLFRLQDPPRDTYQSKQSRSREGKNDKHIRTGFQKRKIIQFHNVLITYFDLDLNF